MIGYSLEDFCQLHLRQMVQGEATGTSFRESSREACKASSEVVAYVIRPANGRFEASRVRVSKDRAVRRVRLVRFRP